MSYEFTTTQEIVRVARRNLSQPAWDYLVGASESETTMRRNRLAFDKLGFSARALARVLKVARTIADLAGSPELRPAYVAEAIQYRGLDRRTRV